MNETDKIKELERQNREYFNKIQGLLKANVELKKYIGESTISKKLAKDLLCLAIDNEYVEFPF